MTPHGHHSYYRIKYTSIKSVDGLPNVLQFMMPRVDFELAAGCTSIVYFCLYCPRGTDKLDPQPIYTVGELCDIYIEILFLERSCDFLFGRLIS